MQWTRRNFMELVAAGAAALGIGTGVVAGQKLEGRAYFDDWRALPGMKMTLHMAFDAPEDLEVTLVAKHDGTESTLETLRGREALEFRIPYVKTSSESYDLVAIIEDRHGRRCESEILEVLSGEFSFGM